MINYSEMMRKALMYYDPRDAKFPTAQIKSIISKIYNDYKSSQRELGGDLSEFKVSEEMIDSIVRRYELIINNGIDGIAEVTDSKKKPMRERYVLNSLKDSGKTGVYRVDYTQGERVDLYYKNIESNYGYNNSNRPVFISLDLETGRIFVKSLVYVRDIENVSLVTYCFPCYQELKHLELRNDDKKFFVSKEKEVTNDALKNIMICDSFHPTSMKNRNKDNKNKKYPHENYIERLDITEEERELMLYYFGEGANEPHFHCHSERISAALGGNDKSFAIEFAKLKEYISHLTECATRYSIDVLEDGVAKKMKGIDVGILMYDLDMPYLSVLKGELIYDNSNFLENIDKLLRSYLSSTRGRDKKIEEMFKMFDMLKKKRKNNSGGDGIKKNIGLTALREMLQDLTVLESLFVDAPPDLQVSLYDIFSGSITPCGSVPPGLELADAKNPNQPGCE